jgi:hypothetical protein
MDAIDISQVIRAANALLPSGLDYYTRIRRLCAFSGAPDHLVQEVIDHLDYCRAVQPGDAVFVKTSGVEPWAARVVQVSADGRVCEVVAADDGGSHYFALDATWRQVHASSWEDAQQQAPGRRAAEIMVSRSPGPMDAIEKTKAQLDRVAQAYADWGPEAGHAEEDYMLESVLRAIAAGAPNAAELARLALTVAGLPNRVRWYA